MFLGVVDIIEYLDIVFGVGFGGVDVDVCGYCCGDWKLGVIGIGCGVGCIGGGYIGLFGMV